MSYYTMAFVGMAPFGSLLAGALAHRFGAPPCRDVHRGCCLLGAAWFATQRPGLRAVMRPIYIEMGIIPDPSGPAFEDRAGAN